MVGRNATFHSEADRWFTRAVAAEDTHDRPAARLHAQQAVRSDPQHPGAPALLGLGQIRDRHRRPGPGHQPRAAPPAPAAPTLPHSAGVGRLDRQDGRDGPRTS